MRNPVAEKLDADWDELDEQSRRGLKVTGMDSIADAIEEIDRLQEKIDGLTVAPEEH